MADKNNQMNDIKIAFIGTGNMASAMISGFIAAGVPAKNILGCAPSIETRTSVAKKYGIKMTANNSEALEFADIIVVAVKPYLIETVAKELQSADHSSFSNKLMISVAAGISVKQLQGFFGGQTKTISAMPNLPCAVKQGVTGLIAGEYCEKVDVELMDSLFSLIGQPIWLDSQEQMPALVAAAGSAPAYFFLFLESMIASAKKLGLSHEQAEQAVLQSGLGALTMAVNSEHDVVELRRQVTSPNGTTHQAIESFINNDIASLVSNAMQAAADKAANY